MADFNCAYCGKYGYGKPGSGPMSSSSSPSGWVQNKLFGFGIKYYCSKKCKQADEGNVQNNSDKSIAFNHTFKEAEKIKAQEEAYRLRDEKEARELAERRARANELRSQGKNFQAFLVEFQNGVIAVSIIIGFALFFFFFNLNNESNKEDAMKINADLELIEDQIKLAIEEGDKDKALDLTNKLVHPSHVDMEHLDFDTWNGYPKFDEYWSKKREAYKKIIFEKGNSSKKVSLKEEMIQKNEVDIETPSEEDSNVPTEPDTIEGLDLEYQEN